VAGAYVWYFVGLRLREERLRAWIDRYGRWLTVDQADLDRSQRFFARWGGWAVFVGRLIPGVRTFISVPAGVIRMRPAAFVAWTTLGTAIWTLFLAAAGYLLAHEYHRVATWIDPITEVVLGVVVLAYLWRVLRFRRGRR
jgi:membrane protein DedA with SNARE-associated domain